MNTEADRKMGAEKNIIHSDTPESFNGIHLNPLPRRLLGHGEIKVDKKTRKWLKQRMEGTPKHVQRQVCQGSSSVPFLCKMKSRFKYFAAVAGLFFGLFTFAFSADPAPEVVVAQSLTVAGIQLKLVFQSDKVKQCNATTPWTGIGTVPLDVNNALAAWKKGRGVTNRNAEEIMIHRVELIKVRSLVWAYVFHYSYGEGNILADGILLDGTPAAFQNSGSGVLYTSIGELIMMNARSK